MRASESLGDIWFQKPQMFSQLSKPAPLKNAAWRLSVWSVAQRSQTFTMCRGSSHFHLLTIGTNG